MRPHVLGSISKMPQHLQPQLCVTTIFNLNLALSPSHHASSTVTVISFYCHYFLFTNSWWLLTCVYSFMWVLLARLHIPAEHASSATMCTCSYAVQSTLFSMADHHEATFSIAIGTFSVSVSPSTWPYYFDTFNVFMPPLWLCHL